MKLNYVIKYVEDMNRAVEFYRDELGLSLRFQSPDWTEFDTGTTTLALHQASDEHPASSSQLGFGTDDIREILRRKESRRNRIHLRADRNFRTQDRPLP